jgi:hypothetical protein
VVAKARGPGRFEGGKSGCLVVEDPALEEAETDHGRGQVRNRQYRDLDTTSRYRGHGVQQPQRRRGQAPPDGEGDQSAQLMAGPVLRTSHAERDPAVEGGVGHGRDQQREHVGELRVHRVAQSHVEQGIGQRAQRPDSAEAHHPGRERSPRVGDRRTAEGRAQGFQVDPPAAEVLVQPGDPAQVIGHGLRDRDSRIEVVHPVHRDLVDPQAGPFGQHEQLGVEEPAGVLDQRQQLGRHVRTDRLEPALGVREARSQDSPEQQVVAPREHLPLGAADYARAGGEAGADGNITVPGDQRRDQRQQRVEICRQVNVHVREHVRGALGPDLLQRPAPARLLDPDHPDPGQLGGQQVADLPGGVGTAVVGDADLGPERERRVQERPEASNIRAEVVFLIANGYDDLDPRMT